jgi:pimeloyl-ACP methyl ester carboxylesterase
MQSRSSLARLQQAISLTLLCAASAWLIWHWQESRWMAIAGFVAITLSYSAFLALEFCALRWVGRDDPAPRPSWSELARAWFGETLAAPRVFLWRQPFRWRTQPDLLQGAPGNESLRGVVFIHGFVCNRGFWAPWLTALRSDGRCYVAVNLEPVFGSIDEYVPIIEDAVTRVTRATGLPPVLVCHSMGGLAARAWLRSTDSQRVHHVITIGTPHRGTWLGQFSHLKNGRQMRMGGEWLRKLGESQLRFERFTCWYSNCDNIVFPPSTATLPGADNRLVRGTAHVAMAFDEHVMSASIRLFDSPGM